MLKELGRLLSEMRARIEAGDFRGQPDAAEMCEALHALLSALLQTQTLVCPRSPGGLTPGPASPQDVGMAWSQAGEFFMALEQFEMVDECLLNSVYWAECFDTPGPLFTQELNATIESVQDLLRAYGDRAYGGF